MRISQRCICGSQILPKVTILAGARTVGAFVNQSIKYDFGVQYSGYTQVESQRLENNVVNISYDQSNRTEVKYDI